MLGSEWQGGTGGTLRGEAAAPPPSFCHSVLMRVLLMAYMRPLCGESVRTVRSLESSCVCHCMG